MDPWAPCPDWRELQPGTEAACLTCEFYPCLLFERRFVDIPLPARKRLIGGDPEPSFVNDSGGNA